MQIRLNILSYFLLMTSSNALALDTVLDLLKQSDEAKLSGKGQYIFHNV